MSASLRENSPFPSPPIISFYAECSICGQTGLFATVDGFLACNWRLNEDSEVPETMRNGLLVCRARCGRCRESRKSPKFGLRGLK